MGVPDVEVALGRHDGQHRLSRRDSDSKASTSATQEYSDSFGFRFGAASPTRLQCRHVDAAAARTPDGGLGCYDLGVDVRVATSCLVTVTPRLSTSCCHVDVLCAASSCSPEELSPLRLTMNMPGSWVEERKTKPRTALTRQQSPN